MVNCREIMGKGSYLSRRITKVKKCIDCNKLINSHAPKASIRCSKCCNKNYLKIKMQEHKLDKDEKKIIEILTEGANEE